MFRHLAQPYDTYKCPDKSQSMVHSAAVRAKPTVCSGTSCEDGANQRAARLPEQHRECRETWKATGLDQAKLQGYHQVPAGDAEARLHW